jgi:hypothetical protein
MKKSKLLPDLGKHLLAKAGEHAQLDFDLISITYFSRIEPELYTTAVDILYGKKKYMVSFDIPENQMVFILKNLLTIDEEFSVGLIQFFNVPFDDVQNIFFEKRPIKLMVSAILGDAQESSISDESFIPFIITGVQGIA